ncbi:MAG: hypothetical protein AAFY56_07490 [Pseudomonadota bacterium]
MNVITNSMLLVRRIRELQRRRDAVVDRQDRLRRSLPEWTFAPLQLVGMSSDEIRSAMSDLTKAEADAGLNELDCELEKLDHEIETLENQLLSQPTGTFDGVQAVLELAIERFRGQTVHDPNDVFYDYGDARLLTFLEHAAEDLRDLLRQDHRAAV